MIEVFTNLYLDVLELQTNEYTEKLLTSKDNEHWEKRDGLIYQALNLQSSYYFSVLSYLSTQEEEEMFCLKCHSGYSTINGNDHIVCNTCLDTKFPKYVWFLDDTLNSHAVNQLLSKNERWKEIKVKERMKTNIKGR